jgi:hypothetical protein
MARKKTPRTLGIVPRTLLRGAIAGAIPACALTGCASDEIALDGSARVPDGGFGGVSDHAFFGDDPSSLPPDGGFGGVSDHAFFSVDAAGFTPDAASDAPDAGADAGDAAKDAPLLGVADVGFRDSQAPPDAAPDAAPDADFFAVDAASFKG